MTKATKEALKGVKAILQREGWDKPQTPRVPITQKRFYRSGMPSVHVEELKAVGPGRFQTAITTPLGQSIPAELIITRRDSWKNRPESSDPRWIPYRIGPAIMAFRLSECPQPSEAEAEQEEMPEDLKRFLMSHMLY